jgi:hypothetical protein
MNGKSKEKTLALSPFQHALFCSALLRSIPSDLTPKKSVFFEFAVTGPRMLNPKIHLQNFQAFSQYIRNEYKNAVKC